MNQTVETLKDLRQFRSAPTLTSMQIQLLLKELYLYMDKADWFTIGIMAPTAKTALIIFREMEVFFNWTSIQVIDKPSGNGPAFLKANQKTEEVYVRLEDGIGEGILLTCQHNDPLIGSDTFGPFPLESFKLED